MLNYIYIYLFFFICIIFLFSFFNISKNFKIIIYIISFWLFIFIYIYIYVNKLFKLFLIWDITSMDIMLIDNQILVTILMDFSFFFSIFIFLLNIVLCIKIWIFPICTRKKIIIYNTICLIFIYYFLYSYWIVSQDLGFSTLDYHSNNLMHLAIEYKVLIDNIYFYFESEFYDICVFLFFFVLMFISLLNKYSIYTYIRKYKNIFNLFYICFIIFLFCGEGFLNDLKILIISIIFLELFFLFVIFLYRLKQIKYFKY